MTTLPSDPFALITGAGSGIGRATAELFVNKGWSVIAVGRSAEKLANLRDKFPDKVLTFSCDLTESSQVDSLVQNLDSKNLISKIFALINNAGIWQRLGFFETTDQVWQNQFNTNVLGSVRLTRELLKHSVSKNVPVSVVNVSSTLGLRPVENTSAYSASKAAMISWTSSLALEVAKQNIRVNCVCPGIVDTPIHDFHNNSSLEAKALRTTLQSAQPLGRMGSPEDIASGIYYLCSAEASWVTGTVLNIDGGISL